MGSSQAHNKERVYIRIPAILKRRLEDSAEGLGRTLNAEIVERLLESYGERERVRGEVTGLERGVQTSRKGSLDTRIRALEDEMASLKLKLAIE